jgi:hypothetical protein
MDHLITYHRYQSTLVPHDGTRQGHHPLAAFQGFVPPTLLPSPMEQLSQRGHTSSIPLHGGRLSGPVLGPHLQRDPPSASYRQVQLFTASFPRRLRVDVEPCSPVYLHQAMALAGRTNTANKARTATRLRPMRVNRLRHP